MNTVEYWLVIFILVPHSFGRCFDMSFSICWMATEDFLERQNGNLWLNDTSLKSIMKVRQMVTLTVSPVVENMLALQNGDSILRWTFTVSPRTKVIKVTGRQKPLEHPTNTTMSFLEMLDPIEVFACESGTTFLHQEANFFIAVGHTMRLPLKLESRSPSMLLVSWVESYSDDINVHVPSLYHVEMGSYRMISVEATTLNHHRFSALDPCIRYLVCVQISGTFSLTCLSTITDPDIPKDFEVTSWNSSSISLAWDCPTNLKFSLFLLTIFYLNGTEYVTEEVDVWLTDNNLAFQLTNMPPCTRVKFGLQTVCQAGLESRLSKMVLIDGNSGFSNIYSLKQALLGSSNYTLSWDVSNISSISMFRVYHEGVLQGHTLLTNYTVGGLLPCGSYQARVEAICGENVLMNAKTVTVHTGPLGVSELSYSSADSTAQWSEGVTRQTAVAFFYELSEANGASIQSSRVSDSRLPLPDLQEGKSYFLSVWEECDGKRQEEPSQLTFTKGNSSFVFDVRAVDSESELLFEFDNMGLTMVLPWFIPEDLQDSSELHTKMKQVIKDKLEELLTGFDQPARIKVETFEPADEPGKTEVLFQSFDASETGRDVPLPVNDQLSYISSLNHPDISVRKGIIYWDGPDLCVSPMQMLCPTNSVCINTLGSYMCVCEEGYYDVSEMMDHHPAAFLPTCKEKGLFSHCLDKAMSGGISKSYLAALFGGEVEVKLNDGRCNVNQSEGFYFFQTPRKSSVCGTEKRVNRTHIMFQNTLAISLTKKVSISRRDLKVVWKCVYPRHYIRNAQVVADMEWLSVISVVEFNSSLQLALTMTLFQDHTFTHSYRDKVELGFEDTLFFQVALQTNSSFAADVRLQVESCWATESPHPHDPVQAVILEESCPVDNTFQWLSANGQKQTSRFSLQMFTMPKGLPLFFHCVANICAHNEDCSKNCSSSQRSRRSATQMDTQRKQAVVVSAGPLVINSRVKSLHPSFWSDHMNMMVIVSAAVGVLGVVVLSLSATKAIMMYYEQMQPQ